MASTAPRSIFSIGETVMASWTDKRDGPLHEAVITDKDEETNSYELKWAVAVYKQFINTDMIHAYDEYLKSMEAGGRSRRRSRGSSSKETTKTEENTAPPAQIK